MGRVHALLNRAPTRSEFLWAWCSGKTHALRWPLIWVSGECLADFPEWFASEPWWYAKAYHDYDRDCVLYALTPLVLFLRAWYGWRNSRYRFCIERAIRGRIADKPEGDTWTSWTWRFRPIRLWSWRRTRIHVVRLGEHEGERVLRDLR